MNRVAPSKIIYKMNRLFRNLIFLLILSLCFSSISEASLHRSVSLEMHRTVQNMTYAYDLTENLTSKTTPDSITGGYVYDSLNRLTSIQFPDSSQDISYSYDTTGKVLSMNDPSGTTYYVAVKSYADISRTLFYHTDHLGTPILVTNGSGTIVWEGELLPFGERYSIKGKTTNNIGLPGQYLDVETGLYQNGRRDYNPKKGGYNEADPIGFNGGDINLFRYAKSNPLRFIDPFGLEWLLISFEKYWDPAIISAPSHEPSIPNKVECTWKCSSEKVTTMGKCTEDKNKNMYYDGTQFWISCCCPDPNKNLKVNYCRSFMCAMHSPEPAHGPEGPFLPTTPNPTPPGLPPIGK